MKLNRVISPRVARLLRAAALQLLHQHLAAPPQGVSDLPEGAAAAQRAVPVLRRHGAQSAFTETRRTRADLLQ